MDLGGDIGSANVGTLPCPLPQDRETGQPSPGAEDQALQRATVQSPVIPIKRDSSCGVGLGHVPTFLYTALLTYLEFSLRIYTSFIIRKKIYALAKN